MPDYLKQQHAYADIWFVDLLEWEMDGDPFAVAASIVGDLRYPNGIRRRALVVLLDARRRAGAQRRAASPRRWSHVAELLGELQSYAALSPLEKLFASREPTIRRAAVRALRFLYFKRSFVIVRKALADPDAQVREAALDRDRRACTSRTRSTRSRASIARAPIRACAARRCSRSARSRRSRPASSSSWCCARRAGSLREAAYAALAQMDNADVLPILRQHHEIETNPQVRDTLGELLRRH